MKLAAERISLQGDLQSGGDNCMNLTEKTCLYDLRQLPEFQNLAPYLIYRPGPPEQNDNMLPGMTLEGLHAKQPTWAIEDMLYGLRGAQICSAAGRMQTIDVYSEKDVLLDPDKAAVKLFDFRPEMERHDCFALLLAGGGYGAVATVAESLPVAIHLLKKGIHVFVLNYRVFLPHLFPKPMQDLQAAFRYLSAHEKALGISMDHYMIVGFSAGAHLAESWNTESFGYRRYQLPRPLLTVLVYPMLCLWEELCRLPKEYQEVLLHWYFGSNDNGKQLCRPFEFGSMAEEGHSPVYLVHALDDTTIPPEFSRRYLNDLDRKQIPYRSEFPAAGGHGFGAGSATPASGWPERAVHYMEGLMK